MAMSTRSNDGLTAEPNVTPMIDVLLVLLIIFMMIIPMSRKAIDLQLPDPTPQPAAVPDPNQIVMEIGADGSYVINKTTTATKETLDRTIHQIYDPRPDKVIYIKGDPKAKYSQIIEAIDIVRGGGVKVIGVVPRDVK